MFETGTGGPNSRGAQQIFCELPRVCSTLFNPGRNKQECVLQVYDLVPPISFAPVVESKSVPDAFLTQNPWDQSPVNGVPMLTGLTKDEGGVLAASEHLILRRCFLVKIALVLQE